MTSDRTRTVLDVAAPSATTCDASSVQSVNAELALRRVVAGHVVPRLAVVTRSRQAGPVGFGSHCAVGALAHGQSLGQTTGSIGDFVDGFAAQLLVAPDLDLARFINGLIDEGFGPSSLLLELFGPTALRLGEWWEDDKITFVDVTVGVGRLQHLVKALSPAVPVGRAHGPGILLLPTPGEDHAFGVNMLADVLLRAGWPVTIGHQTTSAELEALVKRQSFAAIGFSLSSDVLVDRLMTAIRDVRRVLDGTDIPILVGGRVFRDNPDLSVRVGADAAPGDARETLTYLSRLASLTADRSLSGSVSQLRGS
jgi:MerR family transcriptional regulator, light-induced transcriptional regulator